MAPLPVPSPQQVAAVKARAKAETKAALAALNDGDSAGFVAHAEEARVCESWLNTYAKAA